jgi:hypothetical protein
MLLGRRAGLLGLPEGSGIVGVERPSSRCGRSVVFSGISLPLLPAVGEGVFGVLAESGGPFAMRTTRARRVCYAELVRVEEQRRRVRNLQCLLLFAQTGPLGRNDIRETVAKSACERLMLSLCGLDLKVVRVFVLGKLLFVLVLG